MHQRLIITVHYSFRIILLLSVFFFSCKTPVDTILKKPPATDFYKKSSEKLGVTLKGTEDKKLIDCLITWLGTPYKYGGCSRSGTDCSGMVMSVYLEVFNIKLYRSSADQLKNVTRIKQAEMRAGDIVFFKITGTTASHVGIYIADNKFIHASTKRGVVINDLSEEYYKKYFLCAGRVEGTQ